MQAYQFLGGRGGGGRKGTQEGRAEKGLRRRGNKKKTGKGEGTTEEKMGQKVRERNAEAEEEGASRGKDPGQACVSPQIRPPLWRLGLTFPWVWCISSQDVCLSLKFLGKAWASGGTE